MQEGRGRARKQVVTSLRMLAYLAQQEAALSQFPSLARMVRVSGGDVFQTPTYEGAYGVDELLGVLAEVTNRRFHQQLEESEVLGLQVDESTDCGDQSNALIYVSFEVCKCVLLHAARVIVQRFRRRRGLDVWSHEATRRCGRVEHRGP